MVHLQKSEGYIDRQTQLALLKEGKERWNQWRKAYPTIEPDLVEADLCGAMLKELDLRRARLNGAQLVRADLFGSDLSGAALNGANLNEIRAAHVNFNGADLSGSEIRWGFLVKASLHGTRLNGADLSQTRIKKSSLARADLSGSNLEGTHLNQVILNDANMSGANLNEVDLQETLLPNTTVWADIYSSYHKPPASQLTPSHEERYSQQLAVHRYPHLFLKDCQGTVHIRTWSELAIKVISTGPLPQIWQEQDTISIIAGKHDLEILVPRITHGIVRQVQQGSNTITTAISGENLSGPISIEDTGPVTLHGAREEVYLHAITGDIALTQMEKPVILRQINGNIQVFDTPIVSLDVVRGNILAEHIHHTFRCGQVEGNCIVHASEQAEIAVGRVFGNATLHGIARHLDCSIGGNADMTLIYPRGSFTRIKSQGSLALVLSETTNLGLSMLVAGNISGEAYQNARNGHTGYLVYGSDQARLDLVVNGGLTLTGPTRPV